MLEIHLDCRPVGKEVEGIPKQDGLKAGNRLHPNDIGDYLRLLLDDSGVADSQPVQEVHQDDDNEEDESEEVEVSKRPGACLR